MKELGEIYFEENGENFYINLDYWAEKISQIKAFPYSLRNFEEIFSQGRELVLKHGIPIRKPKGLLLSISEENENFDIFYNKIWDNDYLHIKIKEGDFFESIGLTRQRGNLMHRDYKTKIPKDNGLGNILLTSFFGERHPYSIFEMDKKDNFLWGYEFANDKTVNK